MQRTIYIPEEYEKEFNRLHKELKKMKGGAGVYFMELHKKEQARKDDGK